MAATKLIRKLISSVVKKKKKPSKKSKTADKPISRAEFKAGKKVYDQPIRIRKKNKMAKSEGMLQGKRVTQEKAPSKKTKAKVMGTAAKKAAGKKALKKIPKKSDKRIEGSGSQSARPKGSIGKTRTADRPRGGTTGQTMGAAKKTQMRRTAPSKLPTKTDADGLSLKMKREYQDIAPRDRSRLMAIINTGNKERIRKAFSQVDISVSDFLKVRKVFRGG